MTYLEAKQYKNDLELIVDKYSSELNKFSKNEMGMVLGQIRNTEEYKIIKTNYDKHFKQLQDFNKYFLKQFKKEYQQERTEKRRNNG